MKIEMLPAPRTGGFQDPDYWIWCGSARSKSRPQAIGLATASSVMGPWCRPDRPIVSLRADAWDHSVVTNPALCILPDGRIYLYYRSYGMRIGLAVANSFEGPWRRFDRPVINANGGEPIEDMFVWWQENRFHLIAKDLAKDGRLCGQRHGGVYASSDDGMQWTFEHTIAYSRLVRWDDGSEVLQGSLERPQLLFENGRPRCFYAATGDGPGGFNHCTRTWNVAIPLSETK